MASFTWLGGEGYEISVDQGSGIGFFASGGFAAAISPGEWNRKTYICASDGSSAGPEIDNLTYDSSSTVIIGGVGTPTGLLSIPNDKATVELRFTHSTAVQVTNVQLRCFDRSNVNNPPSGVTVRVCEIIHPSPVTEIGGSGDATWESPSGSSVIMSLCPSPGPSGFYAGNGSNSTWSADTHSWHLGISVSPDSVGSKSQVGIRVQAEYA